jgi:predicted nucleic acid-binding protein
MGQKRKNEGVIIDSNVWIGFRNNTDSLHTSAIEVMKKIEKEKTKIIITNFIIQEVFTILSLKSGQQYAIQCYDFLNDHEMIDDIDMNKDWMLAITHFIKNNQFSSQLSMTDISILYVAKTFGLDIISFDTALMRAWKKLSPNR